MCWFERGGGEEGECDMRWMEADVGEWGFSEVFVR